MSVKVFEAREHCKAAEKFLKTSIMRWKPDYDSAADEYTQAAQCYRIARDLPNSKECHLKAAECFKKNNSLFHTAKALENAMIVCKEISPPQEIYDLAVEASVLYQQHGSGDAGASVLDKAGKILVAENPELACKVYQSAADVSSAAIKQTVMKRRLSVSIVPLEYETARSVKPKNPAEAVAVPLECETARSVKLKNPAEAVAPRKSKKLTVMERRLSVKIVPLEYDTARSVKPKNPAEAVAVPLECETARSVKLKNPAEAVAPRKSKKLTESSQHQGSEYIGKASRLLVKLQRYDEAVDSLRREIGFHQESGNMGAIGRLTVAIVLVQLARGDTVAAEKAYKEWGSNCEVAEMQTLEQILQAYDEEDRESAKRALASPFIRNMDIEYARLAASVPLPEAMEPAPRAAVRENAAPSYVSPNAQSTTTADVSGVALEESPYATVTYAKKSDDEDGLC